MNEETKISEEAREAALHELTHNAVRYCGNTGNDTLPLLGKHVQNYGDARAAAVDVERRAFIADQAQRLISEKNRAEVAEKRVRELDAALTKQVKQTAEMAQIATKYEDRYFELSLWECGCGTFNGVNLESCSVCRRTRQESQCPETPGNLFSIAQRDRTITDLRECIRVKDEALRLINADSHYINKDWMINEGHDEAAKTLQAIRDNAEQALALQPKEKI